MKFFITHKYLLIVITLALILRLIWLDRVPVGVSNDELDYIFNGKAVFLIGSDIGGTWNPFSLTTPKSSFPQAEIAPLLTFLFIGILPLSLFTSKLVYALIGVVTVVLCYLIAERLFGKKEAIFVGFVASINPWLIYFGRTAYDAPLAVCSFLFAWLLLLRNKGWKILFAFPFFLISFYSYIGIKAIMPLLAACIIGYAWYIVNKKKYTKQYVLLFSLCLLMFVYYISILLQGSGTRVSELATPNMNSIAETTNIERRLSVQTPLTTIFSNKYVVFVKYSFDKYLNVFSPNFLFLHGDGKFLFSLWDHGTFYYLDVLFLLIGIYALWQRNKSTWVLLTGLALIAPLPTVISNSGITYAVRAILLGPILILYIGLGMHAITVYLGKYIPGKVMYSSLIVIYSVLLLNFVNIYFFRNPIYNPEAFNLSSRLLAKYVSLYNGDKVYVITNSPGTPFKQYLFYANAYNKDTHTTIKNIMNSKKYIHNNVEYINCGEAQKIATGSAIVFETIMSCNVTANFNSVIHIPQIVDSGAMYSIANDTVCQKHGLRGYVRDVTLADLAIEQLSEEEFCRKFIINYKSNDR